ncbi:MAG: serine hydrolase domain-containing protein [Nocardioides sp.]|uniref:serine hydrolase domain-containing protein n=1 Tax=Nocardioides sp. TaxID=35761 RepID=UPI003D6ADC9E
MSRKILRTGTAALAAVLLPLAAIPAAYADPAPDPSAGWQDPTALTREATAIAEKAAAKQQGARAKAAPSAADLDAAVDALIADGAVGVTARVETPDLEWSGAGGVREAGKAKPVKDGDRFHIASNTKTLIATLVMQEVERGTWTLETPANDVLPGIFPDGVTIRHLLNHTSGAPRGPEELIYERIEDPTSWDQTIDALGQYYSETEHLAVMGETGWLFEPGTDFSYSNYGYVGLGVMLEKETGERVEDLVRQRVLEPAGMRQSAYPTDARNRGPFLEDAGYYEGEWRPMTDLHPSIFHAAGAATSTTEDLADLNESLLTGELLSPASVEKMLPPIAGSTDPDYGFGIYRVADPCNEGEYLYGHDGAHMGAQSISWGSPDGARQVTLGWTGRNWDSTDELYDLGLLLEPMLLATC